MTGPRTPGDATPDDSDPGADTEAFRAFAERAPERPPAVGAPFRIVTLLAGLALLALLLWLLFQV